MGRLDREKISPYAPKKEHRFRPDDEPAQFPFGIVGGIDLITDMVDEERLLRRQSFFMFDNMRRHDPNHPFTGDDAARRYAHAR